MQGFYWGMLHPFTLGPQLLMLLALSFFIQQRLPEGEATFRALWLGCIAGAAVAASGAAVLDVNLPLTIAASVTGVLVASALKLGASSLWLAGAAAGLLSGYVSWPDPGPLPDMLFSCLGAIIGSILIVILVGGGTELVSQKTGWPWFAIAVRVAGSWIAAISVLLGALLIRTGG